MVRLLGKGRMDDSSESSPGSPGEAAFMAVLLMVMFVSLFIGWKTPETVVRGTRVLICYHTGRKNMFGSITPFHPHQGLFFFF